MIRNKEKLDKLVKAIEEWAKEEGISVREAITWLDKTVSASSFNEFEDGF